MSDRRGDGTLLPGDAATALVLAPACDGADDEACIELLTIRDPAAENVLSVTVSDAPDERLSVWKREVGDWLPQRATIVDARPPAAPSLPAPGAASAAEIPSITVEGLAEDADPVDLGVAIARQVGAWESTAEPTVICVNSLTALLESFGRERVVALVNALDGLCTPGDVVVHYHLDPGAHDGETVATFRPLCDAVIEYAPDHGWTVTRAESPASPSFRGATAPPGTGADCAGSSGPTPIPQSFDTVLDLLSVPRRRTLLYHLKDREAEAITFDELVDAVLARERAVPKRSPPDSTDSRAALARSLDRVHLPALEEAGIVEFRDGEVRYRPNPALESCLDYFETLELG